MADRRTEPSVPDRETTLFTARMALEPLRVEHAASLFAPLQARNLYTFLPDDPPASLEALENRYHRWERRASPDGHEIWLNWAARLRATGEWVGTFQSTIMEDRQALLAYMIFPHYQRQALAREGCVRIIEHLATAHSVKLIATEIDTRNTASIALVKSLGFRLVGTACGADTFKGAVSDEHRFELTIEQQ